MKKLLAIVMALAMIAALCACGETQGETAEELEVVTLEEVPLQQVDESGAQTYILTDDTDGSATVVNEEKYQLALECVGEDVSVLYEAIGEPTVEPHYASSCMEVGAQDGQHYYDEDGFYVTTLKTDEAETVMGIIRYD